MAFSAPGVTALGCRRRLEGVGEFFGQRIWTKRTFLPNQKQKAWILGFREQTEGTWNPHAVWRHAPTNVNHCSSSWCTKKYSLNSRRTFKLSAKVEQKERQPSLFHIKAVKGVKRRVFKELLKAMNTLCWLRLNCFGNCGIPWGKQSAAKLQWGNKNPPDYRMKPSFETVKDTISKKVKPPLIWELVIKITKENQGNAWEGVVWVYSAILMWQKVKNTNFNAFKVELNATLS